MTPDAEGTLVEIIQTDELRQLVGASEARAAAVVLGFGDPKAAARWVMHAVRSGFVC